MDLSKCVIIILIRSEQKVSFFANRFFSKRDYGFRNQQHALLQFFCPLVKHQCSPLKSAILSTQWELITQPCFRVIYLSGFENLTQVYIFRRLDHAGYVFGEMPQRNVNGSKQNILENDALIYGCIGRAKKLFSYIIFLLVFGPSLWNCILVFNLSLILVNCAWLIW